MSEPRRWLERNDLEAGDAVTQLLKSQRGFLPLDAALASRVKHAVLHASSDVPVQPWAQRGVLGRVGAQLSRLGRHQFSASAVAATTLGAATLGAAALGGLLAMFGNPFAASSVPGSDPASVSANDKAADEQTAQRAAGGPLLSAPAAPSRGVMIRSARDPWAASLWNRAEGGAQSNLRCEPRTSNWGVSTSAETSLLVEKPLFVDKPLLLGNPLLGNPLLLERCTPELAAVVADPDGFEVVSPQTTSTLGADRGANPRLVEPALAEGLSGNSVTGNSVTGNSVTGGALKRAVTSDRTSSHRTGGYVSGRSSGDPRGLREETLLLEAARSDLARNPRSALRTALEHQQQFPQGQLTLQRVLIQVEALLRLGQDASALHLAQGIQNPLFSSRAKDLLTRYGAVSSVSVTSVKE